MEAPARATGLPRAVHVGCAAACVVEVRLTTPASAVVRVATGSDGPGLLARTRRLVPESAGGTRPVRLTPTRLGTRLLARGAPGRLIARVHVQASDAAGPVGEWTGAVTIGPNRPWPHIIGHSAQGRPIVALLPADPAGTVVVAAIHGNEPSTARAARAAVDRVGADRLAAVVVPVANPDGLARGTRLSARGVDLNRNFASRDWGSPQALFPGPRPASEPETRALTRLMLRLRPRRLVTVHSPLALIVGSRTDPVARRLAAGTGLPLRPTVGYPTPGAMSAWARPRGIRSVTVELPPGPPSPRLVAALAAVMAQ